MEVKVAENVIANKEMLKEGMKTGTRTEIEIEIEIGIGIEIKDTNSIKKKNIEIINIDHRITDMEGMVINHITTVVVVVVVVVIIRIIEIKNIIKIEEKLSKKQLIIVMLHLMNLQRIIVVMVIEQVMRDLLTLGLV